MPQNVEIKAKVANLKELLHRAEKISGAPAKKLIQEDTFFNVANGRLKLRTEACGDDSESWLIFYKRPDETGPCVSDYSKHQINPASESVSLQQVLLDALGQKGKVSKVRHLFMVGQTRIHVDEVKDLGNYMELEVVLQEEQPASHGESVARDLMQQLGIQESDLIKVAYMDLLLPSE